MESGISIMEASIRNWAEQTVCTVCDKNASSEKSIECMLCSQKVHADCIGLDMVIHGHIMWTCQKCGPFKMQNIFALLKDMKQSLDKLVDASEASETTKSKTWSNVVADGHNKPKVKNPQVSKVFNMENRRERLTSTSSTVKRNEPDDGFEVVNQNKRRPKREPPKVGNQESTSNFSGVKKIARHHIYLGRASKSTTITDVKDWCSSKGADVMNVRELTNDKSDFRSFHLVFDAKFADKIDKDEFWPANIVHNRYYLNKDAIEWLKKNSQPAQIE